jgi:hypothetical protein
MNTYATIGGYTNPLLVLETVESIPADLKNKHKETLHKELDELNTVLVISEDETEIFMAEQRMHTILLSLKMSVTVDYAEAIEKYGAIIVNSRGGYCSFSPKDVIKQWEAETAEGAVC